MISRHVQPMCYVAKQDQGLKRGQIQKNLFPQICSFTAYLLVQAFLFQTKYSLPNASSHLAVYFLNTVSMSINNHRHPRIVSSILALFICQLLRPQLSPKLQRRHFISSQVVLSPPPKKNCQCCFGRATYSKSLAIIK